MRIRIIDIILHTIGFMAILAAAFIWFWLGTIGLYISLYSWDMSRNVFPFLMGAIGIAIGLIVFRLGIGIIRRKERARRALTVFWSIVSVYIIGYILFHIHDSVEAGGAYFTLWLEEVLVWSAIAVIGILHVVFLRSSKVKELFRV